VKQKAAGNFRTIAQSQVDFVETYHLQYLLVSKNASLPPLLQSKVKQTIIDPASGEKFYLLQKPVPEKLKDPILKSNKKPAI
jgi:hypothetical protein